MAADANAPVQLWQHLQLEREARDVKRIAHENRKRLEDLEKQGAADIVEFREMHNDLQQVNTKLDRLIWAVVGLALTIAGSAVGIAITTAAHP